MTTYFGLTHPNPNLRQYNVNRRDPHGDISGTIVVHTAENYGDSDGPDSGAEGAANFISSRTTYGSYHVLTDSDSIIPYLPLRYEAFHETSTNHWSIGLSAACRTTDWKTKPKAWVEKMYRNLARAAADIIEEVKRTEGIVIPLTHITKAQALARKPGFIGHGEIDTGRRSDPGADFDWKKFLAYTREALNEKEDDMPLSDADIKKVVDGVWDKRLPAEEFDGSKISAQTTAQRLTGIRKLAQRQDRRQQEDLVISRALIAAVEALADAQGLDGQAVLDLVADRVDKGVKEALSDVEITLSNSESREAV